MRYSPIHAGTSKQSAREAREHSPSPALEGEESGGGRDIYRNFKY
jgi:hypothetical protein